MADKRILTAREKILLHLPTESSIIDDQHPYTQKGISQATGVLLNHVPREIAGLKEEGLVHETRQHVPERGRRLKVYSLTPRGRNMVERIERKLSKIVYNMDEREKSLLELYRDSGLEAVQAAEADDLSRLAKSRGELQRTGQRMFHGVPDMPLLNRKEETKAISAFLSDSKSRIMVVYGATGIGKKSTLAHCLKKAPLKRVVWLDASRGDTAVVEEQMQEFLRTQGLRWDGTLKSIPPSTVLAVVDYQEPEEKLVDMLASLAEGLGERKGVKMIVTAREDTPVYDRFYSLLSHTQLTLKGLGIEDSGRYMGIVGEELKTIHQFLKGKPLAMKYLLEEDRKGLLDTTTLNPEELRLLFYLRDKGMKREGKE